MASMVAGGLFNAFAFAGAGYLFSKLNHNNYEEEMNRHSPAVEKLARDKELWYEKEVARRNKEAKLRQELTDANRDINTTNKSLQMLKKMLENTRLQWTPEPRLEDYYKPSKEMQEYQYIFLGATGIIGGWLLGKIILMGKS